MKKRVDNIIIGYSMFGVGKPFSGPSLGPTSSNTAKPSLLKRVFNAPINAFNNINPDVPLPKYKKGCYTNDNGITVTIKQRYCRAIKGVHEDGTPINVHFEYLRYPTLTIRDIKAHVPLFLKEDFNNPDIFKREYWIDAADINNQPILQTTNRGGQLELSYEAQVDESYLDGLGLRPRDCPLNGGKKMKSRVRRTRRRHGRKSKKN